MGQKGDGGTRVVKVGQKGDGGTRVVKVGLSHLNRDG